MFFRVARSFELGKKYEKLPRKSPGIESLDSIRWQAMKPKQLQFPYSWDSRIPLFLDGVLYVPKCYENHASWSKEELWNQFFSFRVVSIEYCSGNGGWIAEKALDCPDILWIAVEKRFDRVQKIWAKKHNLSIPNLLVVCGEGVTFSKFYVPEGLISQVFVNFPDPWPKAKHAKHRIVKKDFVQEIARITKNEAEVTLVTDDEPYSEQIIEQMMQGSLWKSFFPSPFYKTSWPDYGDSFFGSLWEEKGKTVRYMKFIKNMD